MTMFHEFLTTHARGSLDEEATAEFRDLINAVVATQKKGTITVQLTVAPSGARMVTVSGDVKAKKPETPEANVFYVDRAGDLHREDPYQERLPYANIDPTGPSQVVQTPAETTGPIVDADTGEILSDPITD